MEITFNAQGNPKQLEAVGYYLDDTTTDIVYGGSKGSGKSFLGCSLMAGDALIYPGTHYFIARQELNDLRKFTLPSIYEALEKFKVPSYYYKFNGQDNFFRFHNDSKIFLLEAKYKPSDPKYMRFGSMQMTRGMIEEAGEIESEAKNNLSASVGRWKNDTYSLTAKLLQTCNPSKNYLYSDYYKPWKEGKLEDWKKFVQALPQDNKMLSKGYLEHLNRTLSYDEKQRLLYGNWEYNSDPLQLFPSYDRILEIFTNEFLQPTNQKYLTADIAYEGSDKFVIGIWHGWVLVHIEVIDKIDDLLVAKKIHDLRVKWGVPLSQTIYDADGLKTFVRQAGKTGLLDGAVAFHNNGKPFNGEKYFNIKAQLYFHLAEKVADSGVYVVNNEVTKLYRKYIIEDLEQIKKLQRKDDNEPHRLEKKEDLKERLRRSPDFADMMMMRGYFDYKSVSTAKNWASAFG